jgi:hypothetical protein
VLTDASGGRATVMLKPGDWTALASRSTSTGDVEVAGTNIHIPSQGPGTGAPVSIPLQLGPGSRVSGRVLLEGRTDHSGVLVAVQQLPLGTGALTDAQGRWAFSGLPPGTWYIVAIHEGYESGVVQWVIPAPGSDVIAQDLELHPQRPGQFRARR